MQLNKKFMLSIEPAFHSFDRNAINKKDLGVEFKISISEKSHKIEITFNRNRLQPRKDFAVLQISCTIPFFNLLLAPPAGK
jgi:hypothetical protein